MAPKDEVNSYGTIRKLREIPECYLYIQNGKHKTMAMNINEKLFLESKKDSFEGMIKIHEQILLEESKKIAEILNIYPSSLNEDEIEKLDIAIKPVKQKVIRMSK